MCFDRSRVPFFDIWTSKSGLDLVWFVHLISFVLQRSEIFSTSELPRIARDRQFCYVLTLIHASRPQRRVIFRHPNFQEWFETEWLGNVLRATAACNCSFLIWAHGSAPAASRPTNHKINKMFRDFPNMSRACFLVLLALSVSLFYLSSILLFSDLYFPYCRKFGLF